MASKKLVASILIAGLLISLSGSAVTAAPEKQIGLDLVQQKLGKKIEKVQFMETPLSEVMDNLRVISGLNIVPNWQSLSTAGIERDRPISLELHDVTIKTVLRMVLQNLSEGYYGARIAYVVEDEVVVIATQEDLATAAQAEADFLQNEVQQRLRKKIKKVHFEETSLREAIQILRDASGLNIHVKWGLLAKDGIESDQPVNVQLHDVTAEKAVAVVVDHISTVGDIGGVRFAYVVDENVVTITSVDDLREAAELAADEAEAAEAAAAEVEFPQKKAERIEMKLELIERLQKVCLDPAAAGLIATAGLKDDVSRDRPEIIKDLEAQLAKTKSLGLRNALHLCLRDLYKASENDEKVLEHLRAMLAENDAAIAKREAPRQR